jgi:hypothetical protein
MTGDPQTDIGKEPSSEPQKKSGLYKDPEEALKFVTSEFRYWSGRLTDTSLQMCYALIAANWLVFGSLNGILQSMWAKVSLLMALLALTANVIGAWMLTEDMRKRIDYGEENSQRWAAEFNAAAGTKDPWPFTQRIVDIGIWTRRIKAGFTLAGGLSWVIGTVVKAMSATPIK